MDSFGAAHAPPEYLAVQPIADFFLVCMGVGWIINYIAMIYKSFQDRTYGMAIIPLCCNFSWEVVYSLIYPAPGIEHAMFFMGLALNFAVIYAAIRFGPNEWTHAPLVRDNIHWIFIIGIVSSMAGHLALAAEIGPYSACIWSAFFCQVLLSIGGICQLLSRCSTRGTSYILWLSRFLGTAAGICFFYMRWKYWPESFPFMTSPLLQWAWGMFLLVDGSYGVCYWYIKQYEQRLCGKEKEEGRGSQ